MKYHSLIVLSIATGLLLSACDKETESVKEQTPAPTAEKVESATTKQPDPEMKAEEVGAALAAEAEKLAAEAEKLKGSTIAEAAKALGQVPQVENPYARAVPPGQMNSAAFMVVTNNTDQPRAIVAASSSVSEVVELHTHTNVDGVMQMRQIPQIDLPAQQTTELKPGGLHIMLIGLQQDMTEGSSIEVTLKFDDNSTQTISMPVKPVMSKMHMKHKHGQ